MKAQAIVLGIAAVGSAFAVAGLARSEPKEIKIMEFATTLVGRTPNQRHNSLLACNAINGAIVQPHAEFSFNKRCGSWSRDAGYRRAPVSFNGTLIDAWGGGVCQTSTTLYNVALESGMEILARSPHRFAPSYIPPGRDAAVAFSGIDLKFRNTLDTPLRIESSIEGDLLKVAFFSTKRPHSLPQLETKVTQKTDPMTYNIASQKDRSWVRNAGKPGWNVVTYRVWKDKKERVSIDSYPVMHRITENR